MSLMTSWVQPKDSLPKVTSDLLREEIGRMVHVAIPVARMHGYSDASRTVFNPS